MQDDIRAETAQYYDTNPAIPDDIAFYKARLPSSDASVLELGCGTGRVLHPLAASCGFIYGIDWSWADARALPSEVASRGDTADQSAGGARRYHSLCPGSEIRS